MISAECFAWGSRELLLLRESRRATISSGGAGSGSEDVLAVENDAAAHEEIGAGVGRASLGEDGGNANSMLGREQRGDEGPMPVRREVTMLRRMLDPDVVSSLCSEPQASAYRVDRILRGG